MAPSHALSIALFVLLSAAFLSAIWKATGPIGLVGGLVIHLGLAYGIFRLGLRPPPAPATILQFDVRAPPPPPVVEAPKPPEPPKPMEPPPKPKAPKIQKLRAPIPNTTPPKETPPPAEPPKPIVGLSEDSTVKDSSFSMNRGNTTIGDPTIKGRLEDIKPLPAAPPQAAPGPSFKPATALEVKTEPDVDPDSCRLDYPDGEAKQAGIEGDTLLRVEIDERGKVHDVRLIKGVGHGLDQAAIFAVKHRCKFTPARNTAGQAVAFVIPYTYQWVIDR